MRPAEFVVVAGPNGFGKSTIADQQEGGHDVPEDKIRERWSRSMDNLSWFAARADRVVVFDNSGDVPRVIALRHLGGVLELRDPQHPAGQRLRDLAGTAVVR